jgi:hypothetical protein
MIIDFSFYGKLMAVSLIITTIFLFFLKRINPSKFKPDLGLNLAFNLIPPVAWGYCFYVLSQNHRH